MSDAHLRRTGISVLALVAALVVATFARSSAQAAESPCDIQTSERVVAIGDVHGAYDSFLKILRTAQLIDASDRWSGGRAVLIQTGDVLDRGGDSRRALDLLRRLERDASGAGGRVYALLGNHEVMRMVGDWRYVSEGEYAAFRTSASPGTREKFYERLVADAARRAKDENRPFDLAAFQAQFEREVPLGALEMRAAFGTDGEYGKWLRARNAVVKVNGIAFLHGGISETTAAIGCQQINDTVRREIAGSTPPPDQLLKLLATSETGPLWYRGLAQEPEDSFAPTLDRILTAFGARAIVVGHTPVLPGRITARFGGRVIQIDSGMLDGSFFPNGVPSALEITSAAAAAIYEDRREPVALAGTLAR